MNNDQESNMDKAEELTDQDKNQSLTKMTSGAEELRDHDFAVPRDYAQHIGRPAAVDTGAPPPEAVHPGGAPGEFRSDQQEHGDIGAIFDQVAADPANPADG